MPRSPGGYITVELIDDTWHVVHLDANGRPDPRILDLFDTHIIQSPYYPPMTRQAVVDRLRALGYDVR